MIARSEDEFEKFQQMDIERRRQEAALGAERKPRLIEESELPPFLLQARFYLNILNLCLTQTFATTDVCITLAYCMIVLSRIIFWTLNAFTIL